MKNLLRVCFALVLPLVASGCASITGSTNQSVSVQTREHTGVEVVGAACELMNDAGKWFVTTPGSVSIHKSNKDLQVSCKKDGFEPGRAAVVSETKAAMFGNILFGGGVGAIIDHNSGAAYLYPTAIDVLMGSFTKIEMPKKPDPSSEQDKPATTQTTAPSEKRVSAADTTASKALGTTAPINNFTTQKLRELQALKNDGVITEEDFQSKKKQLLEKL